MALSSAFHRPQSSPREPDGYVIGIVEGGELRRLTDADARDRASAEAELAQWRQQPGGKKRFVLCSVRIEEG